MSQSAVERTLGKRLKDERLREQVLEPAALSGLSRSAPHTQWKEEPSMLQRTFVAVPIAIAIVALVVGCAGPTASSTSRPAASALTSPSELAGTWAGTVGAAGGSSSDEG